MQARPLPSKKITLWYDNYYHRGSACGLKTLREGASDSDMGVTKAVWRCGVCSVV